MRGVGPGSYNVPRPGVPWALSTLTPVYAWCVGRWKALMMLRPVQKVKELASRNLARHIALSLRARTFGCSTRWNNAWLPRLLAGNRNQDHEAQNLGSQAPGTRQLLRSSSCSPWTIDDVIHGKSCSTLCYTVYTCNICSRSLKKTCGQVLWQADGVSLQFKSCFVADGYWRGVAHVGPPTKIMSETPRVSVWGTASNNI